MHITVNGARLFFDVRGEKLVPVGPRMVERPTLILLHGGPGGDHSMFRPRFDDLSDIAQIIYLDHRGNGRSERRTPDEWTLAQWGDDVKTFCDLLGIEKPIVLGYSFGGMVLQAYATRHPAHPARTSQRTAQHHRTPQPARSAAARLAATGIALRRG